MNTRTAIALASGFVVALFGFTLWRPATVTPPTREAAPPAAERSPTARDVAKATPAPAPQRTIKRPFLVRPAELFVATDEAAAHEYRRDQAKELFGTLRRRLGIAKMMSPDPDPEALEIQTAEYLAGWTDGVVRAAPDLVDEFAQEVQETLCAKERDPALLLVTFRLIGSMPELASDQAFDCIFSQHHTEDVVLWGALDAWRASGLPKSPALAALERSATDPRTHMHLQPKRGRQPQGTSESEAAAAALAPTGSETLTATKGDHP